MLDVLRQRAFGWLIGTQFLTVLNDNAFRQTVFLLAVGAQIGSDSVQGDLQARAGLVFALPFLMFGVFAGDFADRISKRTAVLLAKWCEVGVMAFATLALLFGELYLSILALFLMGAQSAFLSPAKYGLVPELIKRRDLTRANSLMHTSVMLGIILGQASGGLILKSFRDRPWVSPAILTAVAVAGVWMATGIQRVPPSDPHRRMRLNPFARLPAGLKLAAEHPPLLAAILGHGVFHLVGAAFLYSWNEMGLVVLGVDEGTWSVALAGLSVLLAIGALLAGRLCRERLRAGLVPVGSVLLGLSLLAVAAGPRAPLYAFAVLGFGYVGAGIYIVPLKTLLQQLPPAHLKGQIIGASITVDWIFIVAASFLKEGIGSLGIGPIDSFWVLGGIMMLTALALVPIGARAAHALREPPG